MERRGDHRRPPRPPFYATSKPGWCRMCGEPIMKGGMLTSRYWHPTCAVRWTIMNQPAQARRFLFKRDKGRCAQCGEVTADWQADHIVPLRFAARPVHWTLENLQTLCVKHHKEKTRADRVLYGK